MRWLCMALILLVGCPELNRTPTTVTGVSLLGNWFGQVENTRGVTALRLEVQPQTNAVSDNKLYWQGTAKFGQVDYNFEATETLPVDASCLSNAPKGACQVPFYLARSSLEGTLRHPKLPSLELLAERRLDGSANSGRLTGTLVESGVNPLSKDVVRLERQ
jgi:hypothetical protein